MGRDRELGSVTDLLADPKSRGIVVTGAAGVGKTRLATEAADAAAAHGLAVAWVRATRSSAELPLGAFGALLPPAHGSGAALLSQARSALAEHAGEQRLVLCVDDAQWLDQASAALTHQLVAGGQAFAFVTIRHGEAVPDAVRALWKDDLCPYVELLPLTRDQVGQLVTTALGGPVDGATLVRLWDLTQGNALFLRELVLHGIERGTLAEDHGIWRWRGDVAGGLRVAELVEARLEHLRRGGRELLDAIALAAPLPLALVAETERTELAALEAHQLVERREHGRRRVVDVAHPLHGEVVRARLPPTRAEALHRLLADVVEGFGLRRRGDVLRVATWRLDGGGPADAELLRRAAEHALVALDDRLGERLARAAVDAGGGFDARLIHGRALALGGRSAEAERLRSELEPLATGDAQRGAIAIATARNAFWALDRPDEADGVLRRALDAISDGVVRDEVHAVRLRLLSARGRPDEALEATAAMLADPEVLPPARLHAAMAATEGLMMQGRLDEATAVVDRWIGVAREHRDDVPLAEPILLSMRAIADRLAGRLAESEAQTRATYGIAIAEHGAYTGAVEAAELGYVLLARGQVREALQRFRESASPLRDSDAVGMLGWALSGLAQAAAQAGDAALAREAVTEMTGRPLGHKGFEPELGLARAWTAAAEGELSAAARLAAGASDLAHGRGQRMYAVRALHEALRLGAPARGLPALAEGVDGAFARLAAAHAQAVTARDGAALFDVAEQFAGLGALLVAAEAADAAASAFAEEGRKASARRAAARSASWLTACEGARPPTLGRGPATDELTPREREIALLAAGGLSSRAIAARLVVSVRTVDNHLQRAYRKLGVSRRAELADLIRPRERAG